VRVGESKGVSIQTALVAAHTHLSICPSLPQLSGDKLPSMAARVASAQHPLLSHLPAPTREHVAPVAPERPSAAPTLTKEPPPYGTPERRVYLPRRNDDFGGGGAFPEVRSCPCSKALSFSLLHIAALCAAVECDDVSRCNSMVPPPPPSLGGLPLLPPFAPA